MKWLKKLLDRLRGKYAPGVGWARPAMRAFASWWTTPAPGWKFWMPQSGAEGGCIFGLIVLIVLGGAILFTGCSFLGAATAVPDETCIIPRDSTAIGGGLADSIIVADTTRRCP